MSSRHFPRSPLQSSRRAPRRSPWKSRGRGRLAAGGTRFVRAIKPLKHARQIFRRNPRAGVAHGQNGHAVLRFQFHAHFAVGRLYWIALVKRFVTTCASRSESPVISNGCKLGENFHAAFVGHRLHQFDAIGNGFGKIKSQPFQICPARRRAARARAAIRSASASAARRAGRPRRSRDIRARSRSRFSAVCVCVSITETGVRSSCAASEVNCCCCANAASRRAKVEFKTAASWPSSLSASATLMRCDKSPAEIFTAAALIFRSGRNARDNKPPAASESEK